MTAAEVSIANAIQAHMETHGGRLSEWYVGIAADPRDRLSNGHCVNLDAGPSSPWIFRDASTDLAARAIEKWFLEYVGTDGGQGGGDSTTRYVYAYMKVRGTNP